MTARAQRATITLPFPVRRPDEWTEDAACARPATDPRDWDGYRERESLPDRAARIERVRDICNACPVRFPCAKEAVGEPTGIWSGVVKDDEKRSRDRRAYTAGRASNAGVRSLCPGCGRNVSASYLAEHKRLRCPARKRAAS